MSSRHRLTLRCSASPFVWNLFCLALTGWLNVAVTVESLSADDAVKFVEDVQPLLEA